MSAEVKSKLTLSVPEAAELLGVAKNSLYYSIQRGEFKDVIRIGKRILIPISALEKKLSGFSQHEKATETADRIV